MILNKKFGMLYGLACIQILFLNGIHASSIINEVTHSQSTQNQNNAIAGDELFRYEGSPYYRINRVVHYGGILVSGTNPQDFTLIDKEFPRFGKDRTTVYFSGEPIVGADVGSFEAVSGVHSKDKNHAYYQNKRINQADPKTFAAILEQEPSYEQLNYSRDGYAIYYEDKKIPNSDPASFNIISSFYEKDKHHVYSKGVILPLMDATTFEIVSYPYVKDKNNVFFENKLIPNADSASFQGLRGGSIYGVTEFSYYAKDKNSVYRNDNVIESVDLESFEILLYANEDSSYAKDKYHIYFDGTPILQADVASFELINIEYAKDKNRVYLNGEPQGDLNPKTFKIFECGYRSDGRNIYSYGRIITKNMPETGSSAQFDAPSFEVASCVMHVSHQNQGKVDYVKDKNGVYFKGATILDADPETFEMVNPNDEACRYSRDKHRLYDDGIAVSANIDRASFKCLLHKGGLNAILLNQDQYTSDKNHIYYLNQPIPEVDRETFKILEMDFSVDHKNAYYKNQRIEGVDINTFTPLYYPRTTTAHTWIPLEYSKDKSAVYYQAQRIIGSDPESFTLLVDPVISENKYVKDKYHVYIDGQIIEQADPASFRFINEPYSAYAKDNKNVYFAGQRVKAADAQSFRMVSSKTYNSTDYFKDKDNVYHAGKILSGVNAERFTLLGDLACYTNNCYFTDQAHIYYNGERVTEMDASTLIVLNINYMKDKYHVYHREYYGHPFVILEGADPNEFQVPRTNK